MASLPPVPLRVNDQGSNTTNVDKKFDGRVIRLIISVMIPGVRRTTKARRQSIDGGLAPRLQPPNVSLATRQRVLKQLITAFDDSEG
jgi:hypothetical protein